jgi:Mycobacterium 19 kDa lipoprotein antigen
VTEQPQGPGWWQASDLKWYPPEQNATSAAPPSPEPPPSPAQAPVTVKGKSGAPKVWFAVVGTAVVVVIAALVAGRVLLGSFLPGLLLVAAVALIGATVVVRSGRSVQRKALLVTAVVLVVAVAVPASLKVVYPTYHHFFNDGTSQASPRSPATAPTQASPSSPASAPTQAAPPTQAFPHSPASAKITVDGRDVPVNGTVHCGMEYTGFNIAAGHDRSSAYVSLDTDPPTLVESVRITEASGAEYYRNAHETGLTRGDSQVAKSNETYKITGHIPLTSGGPNGPIVPFEIDVTCS